MIILLSLVAISLCQSSFKYLTYVEIVDAFVQLAASNPGYVKIIDPLTNQTGLPKCYDRDCEYVVAELANFSMDTSEFPTVLITGGMHGNE